MIFNFAYLSLQHIATFSQWFYMYMYIQLRGAQSHYFELFWPRTKLPLNGRKPENNSLIR